MYPVGEGRRNWEVGESKGGGGGPFACGEGRGGAGGLVAFIGGTGPLNLGEGNMGMGGLGNIAHEGGGWGWTLPGTWGWG